MFSDVVGYVVQCEGCGARALTLNPHGSDWKCQGCTDFAPSVSMPATDPLALAIAGADISSADVMDVTACVGARAFRLMHWKVDGTTGRFETRWEAVDPKRMAALGPYVSASFADGDRLPLQVKLPAEFDAVKLPAEFDKPTGVAALLRHHGVRVEFEPAAMQADDEYPVGQVQG